MTDKSESAPPPDLTIAIVSHGHVSHLTGCFDSIRQETKERRSEIWCVINKPDDGSRELIEGRYPWVKIIVNEKPRGFSENNNLVIRRTRSPYFLMLNPDTTVGEGAIDRMAAFMEATPEAGACAPKLLYPDGRLQLSCRRFPSVRSTLVRRSPLKILLREGRTARDYTMADWDHDSPREVDWAFGACLLMRRATLEEVGELDERFYLFCEDIDWCYRAKQRGWKIYYVPDAVVRHDLIDRDYDRYLSVHRLRHYRAMLRYLWKRAREKNRNRFIV